MRAGWAILALGLAGFGAQGCARKSGDGAPRLSESYEPYASYHFGDARTEWAELEARLGPAQKDRAERDQLAETLTGIIQSPNATPDAIQMACRDLAVIGTEKEVPVLAKLLADEATAEAGRYALERIPGEAATKALRQALVGVAGARQVGIINSLGKRRDMGSVNALVELTRDWDPEVASAAATALGNIGGVKAAKALAEAPKTSDTAVVRVFEDSYLKIADRFVADGRPEYASPIYRDVLAHSGDEAMRRAAMMGIAQVEPVAAVEPILKRLGAADARLRGDAMRMIETAPGPEATAKFIEAAEKGHVEHAPEAYQAALIEALGRRGDREALPIALRLANKSQYEAVRVAAIGAMGRLGDATSVRPLALAAATGTESERAAAREALGALKGPGIDEAIVEAFGSAGVRTQSELIRAMSARRVEGAGPILVKASTDPEEEVAIAALLGLGEIGAETDLPAMIAAARERRGERLSAAAGDAINAVVQRARNKDQAAELIIQGLEQSADANAKATGLELLGRTRGEKARAALTSALTDAEPSIRLAAAKAFVNWDNAAPAGDLLAAAKAEDFDNIREFQLGAYARLVSRDGSINDSEKARRIGAGLKLAKSAEEKIAILESLREVYSMEALLLADSMFGDKDGDVRNVAMSAGLQIAFWTSGANTSEARAIAKKVLGKTKDETLVRDAKVVLDAVEKFAGNIVVWQVAGPYRKRGVQGTALFEEAFAPEDPAGGEKEAWKTMVVGADPTRPWILDLGKALGGGDNRAAYLRTMVFSPTARDARIEVGSDDGVKIWVNGEVAHQNNAIRPFTANQDVAPIKLNEGWNTLMMKITNGGGQWEAAARIRGPQGEEMGDLKFAAPGGEGAGK